jgi:hypothetical protein
MQINTQLAILLLRAHRKASINEKARSKAGPFLECGDLSPLLYLEGRLVFLVVDAY